MMGGKWKEMSMGAERSESERGGWVRDIVFREKEGRFKGVEHTCVCPVRVASSFTFNLEFWSKMFVLSLSFLFLMKPRSGYRKDKEDGNDKGTERKRGWDSNFKEGKRRWSEMSVEKRGRANLSHSSPKREWDISRSTVLGPASGTFYSAKRWKRSLLRKRYLCHNL